MKKAANAYRTIGEAARLVGVATHVLRYWESQFPQLKPFRRPDGRRYYRPDDIRLAAGLAEVLREEGLTTRGAAKLIAVDNGAALRIRGAARLPADFAVPEDAEAPHNRHESAPKPDKHKPVADSPAPAPTAEAGQTGPAMASLFPEFDSPSKTQAADSSGSTQETQTTAPLIRLTALTRALLAPPAPLPADQLRNAATQLRSQIAAMGHPG